MTKSLRQKFKYLENDITLHEITLRIIYHLILFLKRMGLFESIIEIFKLAIEIAIEIYKFSRGFSPAIMGDIIKLNRSPTYNLRTRQKLYSRNPITVRYGTENISLLAPKIWAIVPKNMKNCISLSSFNINIRKWKPDYPRM